MTLTFPKQQPPQPHSVDPGVKGALDPADRLVVSRLADWIEERLAAGAFDDVGAERITREDLGQAGFSKDQIDQFYDTAFLAAAARRQVA